MDDAQLFEDMRNGAPVAHCRAKIAHDQAQLIERRNRATLDEIKRRPRLGIKWAA
jgi:hypothetical protein